MSPSGPYWLMSGAAGYFAWQSVRPIGPESCDTIRSSFAGRSEPPEVSIVDIETRAGYREVNGSGQLAFLAVELLAELAGPEAVISYYASLQIETTWQVEFQNNFGMTVEEFYELFEERRASGFPRPRCEALPPLVTLPGSPEYMKWAIGSNVAQEYIDDSVEGVRLMHEYAESLAMPEVESEFAAHLYYDQEELIAACRIETGGNCGWVSRGSNAAASDLSFFTNTLRWEERMTSSHDRKKISAHELFHIFQHEWASGDRGPTWLSEGTAEFLAFRALDAGGASSYAETTERPIGSGRQASDQAAKGDSNLAGYAKRGIPVLSACNGAIGIL